MFKCAFLGCGPRARKHADGYNTVTRGKIAAICDTNEERLNSFGDDYGISTRYTDAHEMLEKEQPDLLHVVTLPGLRMETMKIPVEHNVPAVIVEKPIALFGEDYGQIAELAAKTKTKFCVNTQLHFHQQNLDLKKTVADGGIGDLRCIDVSARSTPLDQGVHVLELAHSYNAFSPIKRVFGQVSGAEDLDSRQPSPSMAEAVINFENDVHAIMVCGACAPYGSDQRDVRFLHKRIAAYGTKGFVHWTMYGWERLTEKGYESGEHDYREEDDLAQGRFTEAVFDWLEDENKPHPTRIENSLHEFMAVLGVYVSALEARPVDLPFDPPGGLEDALRKRLA